MSRSKGHDELEKAGAKMVDWFNSIPLAKNAEICRSDPRLAEAINGVMDAYWESRVGDE